MKTEYKYLFFVECNPDSKTRVTKVFEVKNDYGHMGYVKWYSPWRKYCFFPDSAGGLVFDASCLADVQDFLNNLMAERKATVTKAICTKCGKDYQACTCEFRNDADANRHTKTVRR